MSLFTRFKADRSGTAAAIFGICLVPLVGAAGVAIDYARATTARAALQAAADQTSLFMVIAKHDGRTLDHAAVFAQALAKSGSATVLRGGGATLDVAGDWLTPDKQFKVTVRAVIPATLAAMFQPSVPVGASATALGTQDQTQSKITGSNLDPEAADYNEIQAYCYNSATKQRLGPLDPEKGTRMAFAKVADNTDAGVKAGPANLDIRCGSDEQVSFLLRNIRNARTDAVAQRTGTARLFYTDATKDKSGVLSYGVTFDGVTRNTLETILCDTAAQCKPQNQGGILPNNHQTGRTPAVNTKVCAPGKFIYFGWEDRIPGYPGDNSDRDFDDIRLVITCPSTITGPFVVRLVA